MVAHRGLDQARRLGGGEAVLGLALELGVADEDRDHRLGAVGHVLAGDLRRLAVADELAVGAQALEERRPKPGLVGAALGRRDGVAVGGDEAVALRGPVDRPFDRADVPAPKRSAKSTLPAKARSA